MTVITVITVIHLCHNQIWQAVERLLRFSAPELHPPYNLNPPLCPLTPSPPPEHFSSPYLAGSRAAGQTPSDSTVPSDTVPLCCWQGRSSLRWCSWRCRWVWHSRHRARSTSPHCSRRSEHSAPVSCSTCRGRTACSHPPLVGLVWTRTRNLRVTTNIWRLKLQDCFVWELSGVSNLML